MGDHTSKNGDLGKEEWHRVSYKDKRRSSQGSSEIPVTKFFVANIPEGCRPWDLADVMRGFGDLFRVFIAKKRNKEGERFGFVSYKGVKNVNEMEKSMQNVKMGKWTLKINVAWFAKENKSFSFRKKDQDGLRSENPKPRNIFSTFSGSNVQKGVSFKDILKGQSAQSTDRHQVEEIALDDSYLGISRVFKRALVARCSNLNILNSIYSILGESDRHVSFLQYLGGLNMLLVFNDEHEAGFFLRNKSIWEGWFSSLEMWIGQSIPFERVAWVGLFGIPLHLASAEVVNKVGAKIGKLVSPSVAKESDVNKSMECVGVLVGDGERVKKVFSLRWRNKIFRVWVEEKLIDWCPPCGTIKFSSRNNSEPQDKSNEDVQIEEGEIVSKEATGGSEGVQSPPLRFSSPPTKKKGKKHNGGMSKNNREWSFGVGSDSSRPKKRPREDYSLVVMEDMEGQNDGEDLSDKERTKEVGVSSDVVVDNASSLDHGKDKVQVSVSMEMEVEETIKFGKDLAVNLEGNNEKIEQALAGEGINAGYQ